MAGSITMTGADGAHYQKSMAVTSRLVRFPDGITRLINLTGWEWETFVLWPEKTGWYSDRLLEESLEIAGILRDEDGSTTFEEDVRQAFVALLRGQMVRCIDIEFEPANEK